ncbi:hypothetical protein [Haloferula sp. BvORR071]|uniref:hypothetical protein n=1 Tax=Haloferula sp. BvORR071 TaxID=1396141 RepID=UPI00054CEF12|nr:hypothetical protein [Haloferula sp. BvORR071]
MRYLLALFTAPPIIVPVREKQRIPLRHLPLFWLGLLPVIILLWAWADSTRHIVFQGRYCAEQGHDHRFMLHYSAIRVQELWVVQSPKPPPERAILQPTAPWGDWSYGWSAGADPDGWFPQPHSQPNAAQYGPDWMMRTWDHVIPLWLVLLGYAPFWLGASWWQARRKSRMLRTQEQQMTRVPESC